MKTGFINAYADKPIKKRYSYHGFERDCLTQPDPGPFEDFPILPPYGPTIFLEFLGTPTIGWMRYGTNYNDVHNAASGSMFQPGVGQNKTIWPPYSSIFRFGMVFDTTPISDSALIVGAYLDFFTSVYTAPVPFDIVVMNGMPNYPHDYWDLGDYAIWHYSGNGGSVPVMGSNHKILTLNGEGLTWITPTAKTKFALLSSRDISFTPPSSLEYTNIQNPYGLIKLGVYYKLPL